MWSREPPHAKGEAARLLMCAAAHREGVRYITSNSKAAALRREAQSNLALKLSRRRPLVRWHAYCHRGRRHAGRHALAPPSADANAAPVAPLVLRYGLRSPRSLPPGPLGGWWPQSRGRTGPQFSHLLA